MATGVKVRGRVYSSSREALDEIRELERLRDDEVSRLRDQGRDAAADERDDRYQAEIRRVQGAYRTLEEREAREAKQPSNRPKPAPQKRKSTRSVRKDAGELATGARRDVKRAARKTGVDRPVEGFAELGWAAAGATLGLVVIGAFLSGRGTGALAGIVHAAEGGLSRLINPGDPLVLGDRGDPFGPGQKGSVPSVGPGKDAPVEKVPGNKAGVGAGIPGVPAAGPVPRGAGGPGGAVVPGGARAASSRRPQGVAPYRYQPVPYQGPNVGTAPMLTVAKTGPVPYRGLRFAEHADWIHVSPVLLARLEALAERVGKVIDVNSGYRSSSYSADVGGFAGDPHSKGLAVDASINGKPIGQALPVSLIESFGLRSGARSQDFYQGRPDPVHVDLFNAAGSSPTLLTGRG